MTKTNIDRELLISLVENRPTIWDQTSDLYKNKKLRAEAWREICAIIYNEDFDEMKEKERQEYAKFLVKKWNQIRDSWIRSLNMNKDKNKSGSGAVLTKKYRYHNQLLFLKKIIHPAPIESIYTKSIKSDTYYSEDGQTGTSISSTEQNETEDRLANESSVQEKLMDRSTKRLKSDIQNQSLNAVDHKIMSFIDSQMKNPHGSQNEDRNWYFFKGLLPSLTSLNDDQILEFHSGVIQLLQSIKRNN